MNGKFIETTAIKNYWDYLRMINWYEPWLIALCGFHITCLLIIILSRGHLNVQIGIFLSLLLCIYCAEYINQIAAENWKLFAQEQYFDSQGMFISTILSLPVIINCCIIVVLWVYETICLLKMLVIRMKKSRLENEKRIEKDKRKKKE